MATALRDASFSMSATSDSVRTGYLSSSTAESNMSDHELTEEDHEINVLDTDSRLSHSESERSRSRCSSPDAGGPTANAPLSFSISNLLGKDFGQKPESDVFSCHLIQQPEFLQQRGFVPPGFYGQGVLRVPAHRPLGGPSSPGTVFAPWTIGLDPVLQRSAAAAAFASQVVKDRLAGEWVCSLLDDNINIQCILLDRQENDRHKYLNRLGWIARDLQVPTFCDGRIAKSYRTYITWLSS